MLEIHEAICRQREIHETELTFADGSEMFVDKWNDSHLDQIVAWEIAKKKVIKHKKIHLRSD